jgi:hypothetical protein
MSGKKEDGEKRKRNVGKKEKSGENGCMRERK